MHSEEKKRESAIMQKPKAKSGFPYSCFIRKTNPSEIKKMFEIFKKQIRKNG
jgi:hypothetical protein